MKMPQWSPVRAVARHVAEEYDWCPDRPHHTKSFLPWGTQVYCPSNLESHATIFTLPTCSVVSSFFKLASVKMKVHTLSQNLYVCRWPWKYKRPGISGWEKLKVKYKCNGKHVNENKPQVSTRAAFSHKLPSITGWGVGTIKIIRSSHALLITILTGKVHSFSSSIGRLLKKRKEMH